MKVHVGWVEAPVVASESPCMKCQLLLVKVQVGWVEVPVVSGNPCRISGLSGKSELCRLAGVDTTSSSHREWGSSDLGLLFDSWQLHARRKPLDNIE